MTEIIARILLFFSSLRLETWKKFHPLFSLDSRDVNVLKTFSCSQYWSTRMARRSSRSQLTRVPMLRKKSELFHACQSACMSLVLFIFNHIQRALALVPSPCWHSFYILFKHTRLESLNRRHAAERRQRMLLTIKMCLTKLNPRCWRETPHLPRLFSVMIRQNDFVSKWVGEKRVSIMEMRESQPSTSDRKYHRLHSSSLSLDGSFSNYSFVDVYC